MYKWPQELCYKDFLVVNRLNKSRNILKIMKVSLKENKCLLSNNKVYPIPNIIKGVLDGTLKLSNASLLNQYKGFAKKEYYIPTFLCSFNSVGASRTNNYIQGPYDSIYDSVKSMLYGALRGDVACWFSEFGFLKKEDVDKLIDEVFMGYAFEKVFFDTYGNERASGTKRAAKNRVIVDKETEFRGYENVVVGLSVHSDLGDTPIGDGYYEHNAFKHSILLGLNKGDSTNIVNYFLSRDWTDEFEVWELEEDDDDDDSW